MPSPLGRTTCAHEAHAARQVDPPRLGLTPEEFATNFRIPLGTLRDWEQGAAEPDQAARAYLTVIARDPKAVVNALKAAPGAAFDETSNLRARTLKFHPG